MPISESSAVLIFAAVAAVFAVLAFLAAVKAKFGNSARESLRPLIRDETDRLRQSNDENARANRQETDASLARLRDSTLDMHAKFGELFSTQIDQFAARLDTAVRNIDERVATIGMKLNSDIGKMATDAAENRERLRQGIETKLDDSAAKQNRSSTDFREAIAGNFDVFKTIITDTLTQVSAQQRERLDSTNKILTMLTERNEKAQEMLRQSVETRLDAIRLENATKLEEMRSTVDEKLQSTLDTRLGESFKRVVEQLERVHQGIGEMQTLATNVGDLRNVLTNVRVRGTFGEVQLALLLEEFLAPDQFLRDVQVKEHTGERVEFAIRMPRKCGEAEILLPIDAKFPRDDYERLQEAADGGDAKLVAHFRNQLEKRIRACAKDISEKYISPPTTTDFAILFLPTESLYAEILRQPGLVESVHRDCRIMLAGPTTLGAILNAYRVMYRTMAIEQRSTEVWEVLAAIKTEFANYNKVIIGLGRQLNIAANSVDKLGRRTRVMTRKLSVVESYSDPAQAQKLLGLADLDEPDVDEDVPVAEDLNTELTATELAPPLDNVIALTS